MTATAKRNIIVRQQTESGCWVPRDAWYVADAATGECFGWNRSYTAAAEMAPMYENWP